MSTVDKRLGGVGGDPDRPDAEPSATDGLEWEPGDGSGVWTAPSRLVWPDSVSAHYEVRPVPDSTPPLWFLTLWQARENRPPHPVTLTGAMTSEAKCTNHALEYERHGDPHRPHAY